MHRLTLLVALLVALVCAAQPAQARTSAAVLLQPFIAELDVRLADLANATSPDQVELREQIAALRAALAADLSSVTDEQALVAIKKVTGKISKAYPADARFPAILKTALDGFTANIAELRGNLSSRINSLADAALKERAAKGLAKLDQFLSEAGASLTDTKARAKSLAKALARAVLISNQLSKCPGHSGEFGHGQLAAFLGTELFKPKFATGEAQRNAGGQILSIHIDGFHFPYERGAVALTFVAPVALGTYSYGAGTLSGTYQKDNVFFFMESGTATIDEFDPVARRIVARFEFTGRDIGSGNTVTLTSGTLTVCEFKVTQQ